MNFKDEEYFPPFEQVGFLVSGEYLKPLQYVIYVALRIPGLTIPQVLMAPIITIRGSGNRKESKFWSNW